MWAVVETRKTSRTVILHPLGHCYAASRSAWPGFERRGFPREWVMWGWRWSAAQESQETPDQTSKSAHRNFPHTCRSSHSRGRSSEHPCRCDGECQQAKNHDLPQRKVNVIKCAPLNVNVLRRKKALGELRIMRHEGKRGRA